MLRQIYAKVRLPKRWIEDGLAPDKAAAAKNGTELKVAFDTGSSLQTLPKNVWEAIADQNNASYKGPVDEITLVGVTGQAIRPHVKVGIAYFRDDKHTKQLGEWREIGACYAPTDRVHAIIGREIYEDFSFIVPRGNGSLIMGTNRAAMIWEYFLEDGNNPDFRQVQKWANETPRP